MAEHGLTRGSGSVGEVSETRRPWVHLEPSTVEDAVHLDGRRLVANALASDVSSTSTSSASMVVDDPLQTMIFAPIGSETKNNFRPEGAKKKSREALDIDDEDDDDDLDWEEDDDFDDGDDDEGFNNNEGILDEFEDDEEIGEDE